MSNLPELHPVLPAPGSHSVRIPADSTGADFARFLIQWLDSRSHEDINAALRYCVAAYNSTANNASERIAARYAARLFRMAKKLY